MIHNYQAVFVTQLTYFQALLEFLDKAVVRNYSMRVLREMYYRDAKNYA